MAKSRKPAKAKSEPIQDSEIIEEAVEVVEVSDDEEVMEVTEEVPSDAVEGPTEATETVVPHEEPVVASQTKRGGVFVPMLLGGAIAAAGGFGAARYPDQWPFTNESTVDPVAVEVQALVDRVASLETSVADQSNAVGSLQKDDGLDVLRGETSDAIEEMHTQFDTLAAELSELENRIHTVEKLPQGSGMEAAAAAASAYERELQNMRQMLDAELERITSKQEDAQTLEVSAAVSAKAAGARTAMSRVMAALETGQPFEDALFDLSENAAVAAPAGLASVAQNGVATLGDLKGAFPDAARGALDASIRSAVEDGSMDRVSAFFRTQLGTRSLAPKEGDDPDAVLSRAEAALNDGQIAAALAELQSMPETAKPALETWIIQATAREGAVSAAAELAKTLNTN